MQQVVYLIVALAVAAAILSLAAVMKAALPLPEAPLDHAQALVFVKVKPLNGSYWLGVYAPYGDVAVRQIRVGNATYVLAVTAQVGRDTWLNASGRPITVQCGDSVEVVTAKGSVEGLGAVLGVDKHAGLAQDSGDHRPIRKRLRD